MRVVIHGVGAIGGVIAASLAGAGREVLGIARGGMLEALRRSGGLTMLSHRGRVQVALPCIGAPGEVDWRPDDIVLLTVKSRDTQQALNDLRASGVREQAIVCVQNGVANETMALRLFPNVYAAVVLLPAQYLEPGLVCAFAAPKFGLLDIGRFPSGLDGAREICGALETDDLHCEAVPDAMAGKYGKLLLNLGTAVEATLGAAARHGPWYRRARDEAESLLQAVGIAYQSVDFDAPRREMIRRVEIEGARYVGSSSVQSLVRGAGSIETDYLNGEIVLLGRLHDVATPVNAALVRAAEVMARTGMQPGNFPEAELETYLQDH